MASQLTKLRRTKELILALLKKHGACYGRELEVRLEGKDDIEHWDVYRARRQLVTDGRIKAVKSHCEAVFFYDPEISPELLNTIVERKCALIEKLREVSSEEQGDKSLGKHAETVLLKALKEAGFIIAARDVRWFMGKGYPGKEDLDFLAFKDGIWYGVEVKNMLDNLKWQESGKKDIRTILEICRILGLVPMLITRYLPRPYKIKLIGEGALVITYDKLIVHPDFREIADKWRRTFGYPVVATSEPWGELIKDLLNAHEYAKRKQLWQRWQRGD